MGNGNSVAEHLRLGERWAHGMVIQKEAQKKKKKKKKKEAQGYFVESLECHVGGNGFLLQLL